MVVTEVADGAKPEADVTLSPEPKQTPTYTQEQYDKAIRDAKSAVLADAGRFKTEAEKALKAAQDAQARLVKLEQERQERELEAAKDDPAELRRIRAEQKARALEAELESERKSRTELETRQQAVDVEKAEAGKLNTAKEIAARLNVDPARLVKLAKFTDGSPEAIEDIARDLPKLNPKPPLVPDNNRTHGGSSQNKYQVMQDYNAGKITIAQYAEKMRALGEQP